MATPPARQWGVTPPISTVLPTQDEVAANDNLIAELKAQNNFELPAETERRKQILSLLQRVALEFVKVVSRKKGLSQAAVEAAGGKVFAYGSYRLGVYGPVPMNLDLKNNDYLRGLDEFEVRSLNGTRVTDQILELVPQQKTFRLALRAIKLWAQRRAIYSNIVGFPGGVAWAMLVARVCQLYPQATGSVIVGKFFRIMNKWAWPQPVLLKQIEDGPLQMKIWNPKIYPQDRYHLMPIITPAYPSMCATHNISLSTKAVILRELARGGDIVDKIFTKKGSWSDLFGRHSFFTQAYKYYLNITATSKTKEAEAVWSGLVESKLRHLVGALDRKAIVAVAHPFPKGFERIHLVSNPEELEAVKNGSTKYQAQGTTTETTDETKDAAHQAAAQNGGAEDAHAPEPAERKAENESQNVYTTTYYIGLELNQLEPGAPRSLDISHDAGTFKSTCMAWSGYQPDVHDLSITHVRSFELPDDVFQPGEARPTRPTKKKVVKKNAAPDAASAGQKRNINQLESSTEAAAKRQATTNGVSRAAAPA
ncbi:polynucleotide adenylyltransferase [Penicillium argentinense]|uniref:Poly(A) polymerase n=1 Tax=Penicillium argentinense TaxID=1131581 RepID=A0A9W9FGP1_9EURO|nr:polynucleotide adenylyltransferase [Penicillium argentinense]KAJ5099878.1 polynucleotide adenylyltransferase [Penicillium argentinense]